MARSNITGPDKAENFPPGHSTADLGPSSNSDTGSDTVGGPGWNVEAGLEDDSGNTSDMDRGVGAGLDIGDANLESDSDEDGTGERMAAGRDAHILEAGDIAPDRITENPGGLVGGDDPEGIGVSSDRHRK